MSGATAEMSKSAKKRAAKKARDDAHAEEEAPAPAPAPAPAKAKAKAKAEVKPAAPAAEPKAKAKAKAKAAAKAEAAPAPAAPAPAAKSKAKAKGKAKAKAAAEPVPVEEELPLGVVLDDGSGPAWEMPVKKSSKKKDKTAEPEQDTKAGAPAAKAKEARAAPASKPTDSRKTTEMIEAEIAAAMERAKAKAKTMIAQQSVSGGGKEEEELPSDAVTVQVKVPESKVGIIVGPKGATINMIKEKTGVLRIGTDGGMCTIIGAPDTVGPAEQAVKELIERGYMAIAYENFNEGFVNAHPSAFPDLIGSRGAVIRKMKDELGVEVAIPSVPDGSPADRKFKVGIAGSAAGVEKCKEVINDILMYGHHDVTHPGQVHVELDVPETTYRFIIGRAGSELRHVQNSYKVRVNIPREHSENKKVVIIGDKESVDRAQQYIEKVIHDAESRPQGRPDGEKAVDTWGDEEPEEGWMKSYMAKPRR